MSKSAAKIVEYEYTRKAELSPSHVKRVNRNLLAPAVFVWSILKTCIDTAISPVRQHLVSLLASPIPGGGDAHYPWSRPTETLTTDFQKYPEIIL